MVAGLAALPAKASRPPTLNERSALMLAMPSWLAKDPVGCVFVVMSVSNNSQYAMVGAEFLNATRSPCDRYAFNGFWLLKKTKARWGIIFHGSNPPPCSLHVPRDLASGCLP